MYIFTCVIIYIHVHVHVHVQRTSLRYAQDNLGVKKVSAPSKNPSNCPITSFAR
jgi:hypothetical protein